MADLADLVADRVVDALHVELGGERLLDAVDDGELGRALLALLEQALGFVEQPRVFERDAHAVGERLQQPHVRIAEGMLVIHIHQPDDPARLIARHQRHHDQRFLHFRAGQQGSAVLLNGLRHVPVYDDGFSSAQDVRRKSAVAQRVGVDLEPFAFFVRVWVMHHSRFGVVDTYAYVRHVEDIADLVADRVIDALDVELGGQRRLHAVDDRELRIALLALLEEALRFVEETRVFQCDAHARGHSREQPYLGLAERVLALVILHSNKAQNAIATKDGDRDR